MRLIVLVGIALYVLTHRATIGCVLVDIGARMIPDAPMRAEYADELGREAQRWLAKQRHNGCPL